MYIGTSLGKCLKDILDGTVEEQHVLVVVSNTWCETLEQLMLVVEEYHSTATFMRHYDLSEHTLEDAKAVAKRLYESGKLHQPRLYLRERQHGNAHSLRDTWYEIVPTNTSHEPIVVEAYERYRILSGLMK